MNLRKEIAKFFCGFEAFHAIFHAYLWFSGTEFTAFGVTATTAWNIVGVVLNGTIAVVLGFYGWSALGQRRHGQHGQVR